MLFRILDPADRAREKQESRDHDAARLRRGDVSPAELRRQNSFFGALDVSSFKIVAIGGRRVVTP